MYSDILSSIRTSLDRDLLISEIEAVEKALFSSKKSELEEVLKSKLRLSTASIMRGQIEKGQEMEIYLTSLIQTINSLPEVKLTLAFEPTEATLLVVYSWLTAKIAKQIVVDIAVDSKILGGAIISYKGKYYDGSLGKTLEATLLANKEHILEIVKPSI